MRESLGEIWMDANVMGPTNRQSDGAIHLPGLEGPFTVTRLLTGLLTLLSVTDHVSSTPSHLSIFRQLVEGGWVYEEQAPTGPGTGPLPCFFSRPAAQPPIALSCDGHGVLGCMPCLVSHSRAGHLRRGLCVYGAWLWLKAYRIDP